MNRLRQVDVVLNEELVDLVKSIGQLLIGESCFLRECFPCADGVIARSNGSICSDEAECLLGFIPLTDHQVERHTRCPVDTHVAMHHNLGIWVFLRDALIMFPALLVPRRLLAPACVVRAMPDVSHAVTVFSHDLFVIPFIPTVKNVGDTFRVPLT